MKATILALLLTLAAATAARADPVDTLVKRQMKRSDIPGAAVAVIENGRVVKLKGYGDAAVEWGAKAGPDTPFQLASGTKVFTGVLLMRLADRGEIRLDDSIDRYFDGAPPEWSRITVGNLIHYTSGLPWLPGVATQDSAELVAAAMKAPLAYPTGSASQYILTNMILLKAVIEKATGQTYEALLDREIAKPLGLTATRYNQMIDTPGNMRVSYPIAGRAVVYSLKDGKRIVREAAYNPASYAGGGLFSSASDIARLFAALDGGSFLSKSSLDALVTPPTLTDGRAGGWGVGWTVRTYRGNKVVGHTGGPALADVLRVPERKLTIVALTNYHHFYPLLAEEILDTYLPPRRPAAAIEDETPSITAKLLAALASAARGSIDTADFSDAGKAGAIGYWNGFGQGYLTAMGPLQSARLVREERRRDNLVRTYALSFPDREALIELSVTPDGKFAGLYPISEP